MKPSLGRIVHYKLSHEDVNSIRYRRESGLQLPGNHVHEGDVFPAVIVNVWSDDSVNLQVFLDGPDTFWATSRKEADDKPGYWIWPPRV